MRRSLVLLVLLVSVCSQAFASGDVVSGVKVAAKFIYHQQKKHKFTRGAFLSTTECIVGIALSKNPAGAAAVGLPALFVGNLSSYFLTKNPEAHSTRTLIGRQIQNTSGAFCLAFGLSRSGHQVAPKDPPGTTGGGVHVPCKANCAGSGANGPGGSNTPPGSGSGSGSGSSGNGSGSGSGSGSGGGSGSSGGSGGGGSGGGGGNGNGCVQDCGFPGNGGVNGGHDINKPPFPGKGSSVPQSH